MTAALTVAVLSGGRSGEHDVSLASGTSICEGLLAGGHDVVAIEIGRDGRWRRDGMPIALEPGEGLLGADVAFPALHGPFGEDGSVQGTLETLDVPYVGAGVAASALCMDKVLFKRLMSTTGVPQVGYLGVRRTSWLAAGEQTLAAARALGMPVFVKPAHLGSSVGIVKVAQHDELAGALERAFEHDELAIVEACAAGIEVECGVLARPQSEPLASEPGEIRFSGEFYDYHAKYTPGGMELVIPAGISAVARARVQELALTTFAQSGCDGLARVDFFVDGEQVLVNELNTMPGFTPTSVYTKLLAASGVAYQQLLERLCRLGIERHELRAQAGAQAL